MKDIDPTIIKTPHAAVSIHNDADLFQTKVPSISWLPNGHNHSFIWLNIKNAEEYDSCQLCVISIMPKFEETAGFPRMNRRRRVTMPTIKYGTINFRDHFRFRIIVSCITIRAGKIMVAS